VFLHQKELPLDRFGEHQRELDWIGRPFSFTIRIGESAGKNGRFLAIGFTPSTFALSEDLFKSHCAAFLVRELWKRARKRDKSSLSQ
jgi:hypothetical protein